jgi:hypothetical protein
MTILGKTEIENIKNQIHGTWIKDKTMGIEKIGNTNQETKKESKILK